MTTVQGEPIVTRFLFSLVCLALLLRPAVGADVGADAKDVKEVRDKALAYLAKTQSPDGSFSARFAGPGVTALAAAGLRKDDPAIQRALKFVNRCQNLPGETNDQPFAKKTSKDDEGGFTYTPIDPDESHHKTPAGGLRSLGAMTYGGLKSFLYAGVNRDAPHVTGALGCIRRHYTPG